MRSSAPTQYPFSDEHYRIEFKDSKLQYPCTLDNIIVHEGFCMNFKWYLNESVEWKWRNQKPEDKKSKKKENAKRRQIGKSKKTTKTAGKRTSQ